MVAAVQWNSPVSTAMQTSVPETSPASHVQQPSPDSEPVVEQVRQLTPPVIAQSSSGTAAVAAASTASEDTCGHVLQAEQSSGHLSLPESLVDAAITELQGTPYRCDRALP